jgi:hypothetical protein
MDLFDEITSNLKPLGGDLFIDEFVRARRTALERDEADRAAAKAAAEAAEQARLAKEVESRRAQSQPPPRPAPSDDDVESFMNRNRVEGADDVEIQEFLKERGGFDPSEFD